MGKLNSAFRIRMDAFSEKITKNLRFGGSHTVSGKVSMKEFGALKEDFLGEGYTTKVERGVDISISADGRRMVRGPTLKPNNPRSETGFQANFQARKSLDPSTPEGNFTNRNVHVDVDKEYNPF